MKKILLVICLLGLFLLSGCNTTKSNNEQAEVEEVVIEAPNIHQILKAYDMMLECAEYEQIPVLRYNLTCKSVTFCGIWDYECESKTIIENIISEGKICYGSIVPLNYTVIETSINGECMRYEIVKWKK